MNRLDLKPPTSHRDGSLNIVKFFHPFFDQVSTAVKFLQNPRVSARPKSEKEKFLLQKGLTSAEVAAAFQDAGVTSNPEMQQVRNLFISSLNLMLIFHIAV